MKPSPAGCAMCCCHVPLAARRAAIPGLRIPWEHTRPLASFMRCAPCVIIFVDGSIRLRDTSMSNPCRRLSGRPEHSTLRQSIALLPCSCNHSGVTTSDASGGPHPTVFHGSNHALHVRRLASWTGTQQPVDDSVLCKYVEHCGASADALHRCGIDSGACVGSAIAIESRSNSVGHGDDGQRGNRATTSARCPLPRQCSGRVLRRPTTSTRGRC